MSESRSTVQMPKDFAGWFAWEQGLRGPTPVKISKERVPYLSRDEWNKKTLKSWALGEAEYALELEELVKKYPLTP